MSNFRKGKLPSTKKIYSSLTSKKLMINKEYELAKSMNLKIEVTLK